jgi:excisionase family DNA binding protein
LKNIDTSREYIPTPEASVRSGLSKSHITRLLKSGAMEGFQLGRDWLVYTDSLDKYVATPHKPGPKGPIKKNQGDKGMQEVSRPKV